MLISLLNTIYLITPMKEKLFQNTIFCKKSPIHGYGIFADKKIRKGEIVEECCLLKTKSRDANLIDYLFHLNDEYSGIPTGYGAIYNHSQNPNAEFTVVGETYLVFTATRDIAQGEEIFVKYYSTLEWFTGRNIVYKDPVPKWRLINPVTVLMTRALVVVAAVIFGVQLLAYFS